MSAPTDPLSSTAGDSSGNTNDNNSASSYVDYPALTAPTFSAPAHANRLVLSTNLPSDPPPLDLSTPLSRSSTNIISPSSSSSSQQTPAPHPLSLLPTTPSQQNLL
ncbi:hypothetical protein KC316_g15852, partial [Hortaea werneckii]